ncbi:hypothetical protein BJ878DRAFT_429296 [Calycina marina]|uniref:VASt domain-containing protein n=1 Tax=Calycina marina TaxID=1763456 RepID=A0A9P7YW89_9HELO|nr:hypothetical protein BJ878DRAFT_429296 [Calycina marina]
MAEVSQSPTRNGLTTIFSKGRREKKQQSAANSLRSASTAGTGTDSDHGGIRGSVDSVIGKLSHHDDETNDMTGLKKLIPKIGTKRKQRKQEQEEEQRALEEAERGRSVAERGTLENESRTPMFRLESSESQLTFELGPEIPPAAPPPLLSHPSHAGYLTTSSPLIHTTRVPVDTVHLHGIQEQGDDFVSPTASISQTNNLASPGSETQTTNSLRAPKDGSHQRSPSPARRLKEVLRPGKRADSSPQSSPERSGGAAELQRDEKIATGSRRGSVTSRIGAIFPDKIIQERGSSDPVTNSNAIPSPAGNMISHRRIRSGSTLGPSKLSNITSAPLTPLPENGSTTPNPSQGSFFLSVFSAAQNAATTLGNTITNTSVIPGGKHKNSTLEIQELDSPIVETLGEKNNSHEEEEKELAVKTLGMGDLSLSHLGISDNTGGATTPVASKFGDESRGRPEITSDASTARATTPASGVREDSFQTPEAEDTQSLVRPQSFYEPSMGEQTPPNGSLFEGKAGAGIHRSGSISAMASRRKRGSSAATGMSNGTTIGAMISAAHSSVAHPAAAAAAGTGKITGFAVASKKRNRDYHQLFRSVPDDDYLIEDYSCALQKEILAHGRLYVSEGHLCFSSNIFGWVTTLVMSFDEIVSIEKRSTALLFKNGLEISTLHSKNVFASFTSRDSTYDLIVGIWRIGHPNLQSSLNGVRIDDGGTAAGDKTEKQEEESTIVEPSDSESETDEEEGDVYDEDGEGDDESFGQAGDSVADSEVGEKIVARKVSAAVVMNGTSAEKKEVLSAGPAGDFPGPATHAPSDCSDGATHYSKILADEVIQAPLGKVWSLMFGPASTVWMTNWLTVEQKCLELTMLDDASKKALSLDNKVRNYTYIKPLFGAIGPKQTKCICTETLDALDLEKAASISISTQTPDVPSGNVFSVKTRYCLTWSEGNTTRLQINCVIEWTGKSWLKGPIEKGANDGQVQYTKDIIASLKLAVSSTRSSATAIGKKGRKVRKSKNSNAASKTVDSAAKAKAEPNWGPFEPVRPILGPIAGFLAPLTTGNMMYGLLVGLLVASWFGFGMRSNSGDEMRWRSHGPERLAAYEELWQREESELWSWLEDRIGMDNLRDVAAGERIVVKERLKDEKMVAKEVDRAIKVTEERLKVLKEVVGMEKEEMPVTQERKSKLPVQPKEEL